MPDTSRDRLGPINDAERDRALSLMLRIREQRRAFLAPQTAIQSGEILPELMADQLNLLRDRHGDSFKEYEEVFRRAVAESTGSEMAGSFGRRTLPDDFWSLILMRIIGQIESLFEGNQWHAEHILFGSVPTGDVNGSAIAVPDSVYRLILIDDGLFGFANLACKAWARAFPVVEGKDKTRNTLSVDPELVRAEIARTPEIGARMFDFLTAYVIGGHPHMAQPYLVGLDHQATADSLRGGLETFVVAHEYGHCLAGHLDSDRRRRSALRVAEVNEAEVATNWQEEIEADLIGLMLTLQIRTKIYDVPLAYWGIEAFYHSITLIERTQSMLLYGELRETPPAATHPPSHLRREAIRIGLPEIVGAEMAERAIEFADILNTTTEHCWSLCAPVFRRMHDDGISPAARFIR